MKGRLVQMDFSAAFDRRSHCVLMYKLISIGVGGQFLFLVSEFISDNWQRVRLDGKISVSVDVVSRVPQSSVLGPLLFILYTSENHILGYADDTAICSVIPTPFCVLK